MKRRVQAQRKFAQSVALPAHAQASPEAPPPASPSRARECRVIHNKMSASHLLDFVSYHNIHKHKGPVVVLTRLGSKEPVKTTAIPATAIVTKKNTSKPRSNTMRLRSRNVIIGKKVKLKKKKLKKPKPPLPPPTKRNTRSNTMDASIVSSDDDKPLKYFTSLYMGVSKATAAPAFKEPAIPTMRPRDVQLKSPVPAPAQSLALKNISTTASSVLSNLSALQSLHLKSDNASDSQSDIQSQHLTYDNASDSQSDIRVDDQPTNNQKDIQKQADDVEVQEIMARGQNEPKECVMETTIGHIMLRGSFYGDQGIDKWIDSMSSTNSSQTCSTQEDWGIARDNNSITSKDISDMTNFFDKSASMVGGGPYDGAVAGPSGLQTDCTLMLPPQSSRPLRVRHHGAPRRPPRDNVDESPRKLSLLSRPASAPIFHKDIDDATSECPSRALVTVGRIINTNNSDNGSRCTGNCRHCDRVDKVHRLCQDLLQHKTLPNEDDDDVYRFDASRDDAPPHAYQPRKLRQPPPLSTTSSADGLNRLYFDILPQGSPQIIELTKVNLPNSEKRIMKARLVPRSEAQTNNNMSLVEHEILLDQLLSSSIAAPAATAEMAEIPSQTDNERTCPTQISAAGLRNGHGKAPDRRSPILTRKRTVQEKLDKIPSKRNTTNVPHLPVPNGETMNNNNDGAQKNKGVGKKSAFQAVPPKGKPAQTPYPSDSGPLPKNLEGAKLVDAPTFYPTEKEFTDPIAYYEKIAPQAAKYGICKVVAPKGFKPTCKLDETISFDVSNQYIARMYSRWGPAAREMAAIKACLSTQGVQFTRAPLVDGLELSLPMLYAVVQEYGGFNEVNEKKRWGRVAEEMGLSYLPHPERKLDSIYVKYLVPYETLSHQERQQITSAVEKAWLNRNAKLLEWAFNPLRRQMKLLGDEESSDSEPEEDDAITQALVEAEDCVSKGRKMKLANFKKVAKAAIRTFIGKRKLTTAEIEHEYWRLVLLGTAHVCVNAASIDTGDPGYGFAKSGPYSKHPWNLKVLTENNGNVLRSLGPVLGVTVPTLHLGMLFSTSCWHRDPHGLPWIEYMHEGPPKIWYGIPDEQSDAFRQSVVSLCPTSCQNKSIWLPSDITMIPPNLLREHNVSLSRVVQNPGEYIIVFPKAYSCSICTGFTISESVYFATISWLNILHRVFQVLSESSEPTTIALEHILIAIALDPRVPLSVLPLTYAGLSTVVSIEQRNRRELRALNLPVSTEQGHRRQGEVWNVREQVECDVCRTTLYLSKVTGVRGRQSAVCLSHALQMIQRGKVQMDQLQLVEFYADQELNDILEVVQKKLT